MSRSEARVPTDRPHRYAKQLAAHLGRRIEATWDEDKGEGLLTFPQGSGTLTAAEDALLLTIDTEADELDRLEDVVGRHLVRFGARDELVVVWRRDTGEPGSTQRGTGEHA
ncbi:DUF2218 domain-containing protein [Streptomyces sp. NBC_01275]|uniref:DUF2218 domain-containing protein n=1 Tax=Streptomyces sp. NBC_01275 TaxID=2903807 RepID=UPI00224D0DB1|nr:DUF2218 domain-containing protein [Streptomyces sp. NBC_01275]MCX4759822.1 DUF2218 domain-containing protein [Streptomyces sp. NBC_01275]